MKDSKSPANRKVISVKGLKVSSDCRIKPTPKASRCEIYARCQHKDHCFEAAMRWPGFECINGCPGYKEEERIVENWKSSDDNFLWAIPAS